MPALYLPYEFTSVAIAAENETAADPFGIDPEQTVPIVAANDDPWGVDPEQTVLITQGLTSSD
jgi:hypothetical protein